MGQHQTKKLLHAKEKHQPNEDRLLNGRKYLQIMFDKGFISKIYKELIQLKSKKKKKRIQFKNGQKTCIDIFPKMFGWSAGTCKDA